MTRIVLVYEQVPERSTIYVFEASDEEVLKLKECHGQFGQQVGLSEELDNLLSDWLPAFLADKTIAFDTESEEEQPPVEIGGLLIHSGFLL